MNQIIISATILLLLLACAEDKQGFEIVEGGYGTGTHPILDMEIIEIPATGKIIRIDGEAEIKKAELNAYEKVVLGTKVNENDILWIKKDTIVVIRFEDGSHLVNKPVREETFLTFERINGEKN